MKINPEAKGIGEVVAAELEDIACRRGTLPRTYDPNRWEQECHQEKLAGVAISGGGIRSATFALGALQGLAEHELLQKADYCSTVSGGGYIGSWLQGVLTRFRSYDPLLAKVPGPPAKDPISFLRKYSSYLSPKMGLSLDALVIPVLWLRNTVLNQAIIVTAFLALVMVALGPGALMHRAAINGTTTLAMLFLPLAIVLAAVAVIGATASLRKIVKREFDRDDDCATSSDTDKVLWKCIIPITAATVLILFATVVKMSAHEEALLAVAAAIVPAVLHFGLQYFGGFPQCYRAQRRIEGKSIWPWIHTAWMAPICGGVLATLLITIYGVVDKWDPLDVVGAHQTIAWGPPMLLGAILASVSLHIGLMGRDFPDATREWLGRAGAFLVSVAATWAAVFAIAVFAPYWIGAWWLEHGARLLTGASAWVTTTVATILAGRSAKTGSGKATGGIAISMDMLARYGPFVAIGGFLTAVAFAAHALLFWPVAPAGEPFLPNYLASYWSLTEFSRHGVLLWAALVTAASIFVTCVLSWRVNINEFSLHHFYKNRLVRCYMGASKSAVGGRCADPFTGFDPHDDIPLGQLCCTEPQTFKIPYPVVNCCLNVTAGSELATQQRKALNWVFTPRYSGFVPAKSDADHLTPEQDVMAKAFVDSKKILGGVSIGTTVGISGAAVNPGMGYHSSPQTAFLLTLFDVRLGWWAGNPRNPGSCYRPGPLFALRWLFNELTGSVDSRAAYLNLSDGGHFENLGVYELVRRRCRYIIALNAEEDHDYAFGGLGSTIRKARADFGVEIEIDPRPVRPGKNGFSQSHYAVGRIRYPEAGSEPGYLLYLQSSITGDDEPTDVEQFRREFPEFPQQSTGDQFFTEAQFESYRRLGLHVAEVALKGIPTGSFEEAFQALTAAKAAAKGA